MYPAPDQSVRTTCSYCGVGCGVRVHRDAAGRLHLEGDADHPVNAGMLCSKGRALHHVVQSTDDRLLFPQMRRSRSHPLERVDWDTALDRAAAVFRTTIDRYGAESVGFYISGQCLTEEYYVANKLVKGFIGCNNIDTNSRLCMSSAVTAYKLSLGDDLCPVGYDDIEHGDCFLVAGANPAFCHPILFRRLEQHKQARPSARVIVADPRKTQSCAIADLHLQLRPGTDVALYNAIARELIERDLVDHRFIGAHTDGFAQMREAAMQRSVAEAAAICDVPERDIRTAAHWIGEARAFQTWWAMGLNQSVAGVDKNLALINLSLVTGQIGKPGAGPLSLTGQPNAMGGREVGGLATLLAAHRDLANPAHRDEIARYWGVERISDKPGLTATEMFAALEAGTMRAVWIVCTNPAVSMPDIARIERALRAARFVVVQEISSRSDTTAYADVLLPAAGWLEKPGVMTNSERRVTLVEKLVEPPGEALPDTEILCRFAAKMGWGSAFSYGSPEDIFIEHRELTRGTRIDIGGISYERLRKEGSVQWPCPCADHPGTARLFEDGRFATPNQKARLHGVTYSEPAEATSAEHPFVLTTGRLREQWHTMTRTGKVNRLLQHESAPFAEMHPDDAKAFGIADGATARIANERGEVAVQVRCVDSIKRGTVFLPMHWSNGTGAGGARTNLLTNSAVDARSKQPGFKYAAVRVEPVVMPARRIVVIGAGAGALQFVSSYRKRNGIDSIIVFGNENAGFYDRIQLPSYITGEKVWGQLVTCGDDELRARRIEFKPGSAITEIVRDERRVVDAQGNSYAYDALVIATGSSAATPDKATANLGGVFTLRNRADADAIHRHARASKRAVIVGGGLLGIELAVALRALGLGVTLLHRSSRLMGGQLDDTAAGLLLQELSARGVEVVLQETVAHTHGTERILGVRSAGGVYYACDLLIYAVGTLPNDWLARNAGIVCGNGIVVDDALRTNDPNVYALGECAEHRGQRYGTSLAARQQADVVAAQLAGDTAALYTGSIPVHVLKAPGIQVASAGYMCAAVSKGIEEIVYHDRAERVYIRCFVRQNRLIGALLVGDLSNLPQFCAWIESGIELDSERRNVLRAGAGVARNTAKGKLVCSCNQVGKGNIDDALASGCQTLEEICAATGAGTTCGSCRPEVQLLVTQRAVAIA
ncbi:MAG: molybdopterin-dependent oxidoreductase [Candidatus Hydrogenedentes bacterium]|nr:molybdopterin-dependent oxidoreductase [Candidatus Hydrogenedentota bacterium]